MFCSNCGTEISDKAYVCVHCGAKTNESGGGKNDKGGALWWLLGFFIPIAGLIVWALNKDSEPKNARSAGIGAIIGTITSVVLSILIFVLYFVFIFALIGSNVMI